MKNAYIDSLQVHSNTSKIGYYFRPGIVGLESPVFRTPRFDRPNVSGAFVANQLYGGRLITIDGFVKGSTASDYETKRRALLDALKIKRTGGELQPIKFKFETLGGLKLQTDVYTDNIGFEMENINFGNYRLNLYSPEQYLVGQTEKNTNIFIFSGGGMEIPMGIPMDMSSGGDSSAQLVNDGNIDAETTLIFHGPLTNPTLINDSNGEQIDITITMSTSAERVEINTKKRTALHFASASATGTNIRADVSGDWLKLEPGTNALRLNNSNYNSEAFLVVRWRDTYLGV